MVPKSISNKSSSVFNNKLMRALKTSQRKHRTYLVGRDLIEKWKYYFYQAYMYTAEVISPGIETPRRAELCLIAKKDQKAFYCVAVCFCVYL